MTEQQLVLLTSTGCHMCAHGRSTLEELGLPWREVRDGSDEGARLAEVAPPLRPVLYGADGAVIAFGRLSLRRLRRDIDRGRLGAPHGRERTLHVRPPSTERLTTPS